jgi:phage terminase large subunit
MRFILGDVRSSVWQEVKDRVEDLELPEPTANQQMSYKYGSNSIDGKGFKKSSSQNVAKLKSLAGYNLVWVEEAEEIDEDDFNNLDSSIRTQKAKNTIIMTFNMPHKDHWIIRRYFNLEESEVSGYYKATPKTSMQDQVEFVFATYKDNAKYLPGTLLKAYEKYQETNPEYYYTMIKGYVSEGLKGRVFSDWQPIPNKEYEALPYPKYYGLDFGFTNDPSALTELKTHNNRIYLKELIYKTGLTNEDLANEMKRLDVKGIIVADSAEPKSIEEIARRGFNIIGSKKGADSIRSGINLLKQHEVFYTEDSENIANETQNYTYRLDRNKAPTNEPIDDYNHALDGIRYIAMEILQKQKVELTWI